MCCTLIKIQYFCNEAKWRAGEGRFVQLLPPPCRGKTRANRNGKEWGGLNTVVVRMRGHREGVHEEATGMDPCSKRRLSAGGGVGDIVKCTGEVGNKPFHVRKSI